MKYHENFPTTGSKYYILPYGYAWMYQGDKYNCIEFYTPTSADDTEFCSNVLEKIPCFITNENKSKIYCELVNTASKNEIEK
jgi:hypothetical protein